jgi:hypothetical protein
MSQKYALQCSKCYYSAHPQQMWISWCGCHQCSQGVNEVETVST